MRHRPATVRLLVLALTGALVFTTSAPATAADPIGPSWVPAPSSVPASAIGDWELQQLKRQDLVRGTLSHMNLQQAAARGAWVPGLSDAARDLGKSPQFVTEAEAGAAYQQYRGRPGVASPVTAVANSKGVVSITSMQPTSKFTKFGNVMGGAGRALGAGAVLYGGFELGYAVGGGVASMVGLPTGSGSLFCDLSVVIANSDCAVAKDEAYVQNTDIAPSPPGWDRYPLSPVQVGANGGVQVEVVGMNEVTTVNGVRGLQVDWLLSSGGYPTVQPKSLGQVLCQNTNGVQQSSNQYLEIWGKTPGQNSVVLSCRTPGFEPWSFQMQFEGYAGAGNPTVPWAALWRGLVNPDRPAGVEADPERWFVTDWTCTDGSTGSASSPRFHESDAAFAVPADATCTKGEVSKVTISQHTEGADPATVYQWELPPEDAAFLGAYPQCANAQCVLELITTVTGTEVSCFMSPELCTDWVKSPTKDTDYHCRYAGQPVAIEECNLYGPTFNRALVDKGQIYGDPDTAEPIVPVPVPGGGTTPGTGTGTGPDSDPSCPPAFSWGGLFNPWWYYKGTQCALVEAFVPDPVMVQASTASLQNGLSTRAPFSVILAIPPVVSEIGQGFGGGCAGMPDFSGIPGLQLRLPCAPPASPAWTAAYSLMVVLLWSGVAIGAWHMVSRSIGGKE